MWLHQCWQAAAFASEVAEGILARTLLDQPVILFRQSTGQVAALADRCAHRAVPLSLGSLVGDSVQCGYHGMRYASDGRCVVIPGQVAIPERAVVRSYPIIERDTLVWIWMGDPAKADPALVPDLHWFADPVWASYSGYHHIRADYRLLNDNLLDLSHESFLHVGTIGNDAVANSPVTAEVCDERYVRVHRVMRDVASSPGDVAAGFAPRVDRWHTSYYTPPGTIVIANGTTPAGAPQAHPRERRVLNVITPETASSSHYFWGIARDYDIDDQELSEEKRLLTIRTFDQDKGMLEAQQRSLGIDPANAFPVTIKVDAGPIQGRRLLERMLDREQHGESIPGLRLPFVA